MNGLFNMNFLLGMALAKDLPRQERLTLGLAASQLPRGNLMGSLLLKPTIDGKVETETKLTAVTDEKVETETKLTAVTAALTTMTEMARLPLQIETPKEKQAELTLTFPGAKWTALTKPGCVLTETGVLTLDGTTTTSATIPLEVDVDGFKKEITLVLK